MYKKSLNRVRMSNGVITFRVKLLSMRAKSDLRWMSLGAQGPSFQNFILLHFVMWFEKIPHSINQS